MTNYGVGDASGNSVVSTRTTLLASIFNFIFYFPFLDVNFEFSRLDELTRSLNVRHDGWNWVSHEISTPFKQIYFQKFEVTSRQNPICLE